MARIFRFSGYLVCDRETTEKELESYFDTMSGEWWQQFHIEQSEEFTLNGESSSNCDLALLTRHFKADNISTEFDRLLPKKGENISILRLARLLLLSVFQDIQKQRKYQLYMNMRGISGTDLLKCL